MVQENSSILKSQLSIWVAAVLADQRCATMTDAEWELEVAAICKWLKDNRKECRTLRGQSLIVSPKRRKFKKRIRYGRIYYEYVDSLRR